MLRDPSASVASSWSPFCCSLSVCADCLLQTPRIFNLHSFMLVCIVAISGVYLISSTIEKAFCLPTLGALLVLFLLPGAFDCCLLSINWAILTIFSSAVDINILMQDGLG